MNPYRIYTGWCGLTSSDKSGKITLIAAIKRNAAGIKHFYTDFPPEGITI